MVHYATDLKCLILNENAISENYNFEMFHSNLTYFDFTLLIH